MVKYNRIEFVVVNALITWFKRKKGKKTSTVKYDIEDKVIPKSKN